MDIDNEGGRERGEKREEFHTPWVDLLEIGHWTQSKALETERQFVNRPFTNLQNSEPEALSEGLKQSYWD